MPTNDTAAAPGLPPLCYARHPWTGLTVLIVRGEARHHPLRTGLTPEQLNAVLAEPPTEAQVRAMLAGCVFGWHALAANPAHRAAANSGAPNDAAMEEPLPLFPVVDHWGGPDTPFRLMWRSRVCPPASASPDPLWFLASQHMGFYGWLRVADQRVRQVSGRSLLDLPPRDWRELYDERIPPTEAGDVALDEHEAIHGTGPAVAGAERGP